MDKQRLIQYLQNVVDLEKQVYLQKRALYQLDNRIKSLGHEKKIEKGRHWRLSAGQICGRIAGFFAGGFVAGGILGLVLLFFKVPFIAGELIDNSITYYTNGERYETAHRMVLKDGGGALRRVLFMALAAALIGVTIAIIRIIIENKNDKKHNTEVDANYNAAKHADAVRVNNELAQKKVLLNERAILYNRCQRTQDTLRRYYDAGVIYGKYQYDFAAVASFLDYFMSGRCSTLGENRGGDGAYNLYESELRQNLIINKLDQVLAKLDQIRDNQYSLACAIQEGNRTSQRLVQATERLAIAGEQTARNSEIAAYNSQQSANELNQIKWLQLYGMTLR